MEDIRRQADPNGQPEPIQETREWKGAIAAAAVMVLAGASMVTLLSSCVKKEQPNPKPEEPQAICPEQPRTMGMPPYQPLPGEE
ncbi:MAG TPA: hypothetical protein PL033_17785 [Candidatus Brocadiia bacterium]|nr:hypothetical protein [Candidatus Brocadiia bacterium]